MSNTLQSVHPELVSEWSDKNLPLTPDKITFGSNKRVWWKDSCGHEWQASVKARSGGEKCPICSGARVIAGINDLTTLEPLDDDYIRRIMKYRLLRIQNLTEQKKQVFQSAERRNRSKWFLLFIWKNALRDICRRENLQNRW